MSYPSLLCVHGAANGAWVWDFWRRDLTSLGWQVNVLDLRGHGLSLPVDFAEVTMEDYVADLASVTAQIAAAEGQPPVLVGWSMGGLVAQMYAAQHQQLPALVLLSPTLPLEVGGKASIEELRGIPTTPIGPEYYGIYPDDLAASRPGLPDLTDEEAQRVLSNSAGALESGFARRQRHRGISIPAGAIRCPTLVLYGEAESEPRPTEARRLAVYLAGESLMLPGASHWGIVYSEKAVAAAAPPLDAWLRRSLDPR